MRLIILSILFMATSIIQAQEKYMVIGSYTKGNSEGIYVYKFNPDNGDAQQVSAVKAVNPSYVTFSHSKKYVYAVNENGANKGGISAYAFDKAAGQLTKINEQSSNGDDPCFVAVDKNDKWVVIANYSGGNFSLYPIQPDGGLGAAAQIITHKGTGPNKERQEKPHVHSTVFSPDGKHLAVVDLGIDKIMIYPFKANSKTPVNEKAIEVNTAPGSGPRHLIFHPTKPFAYVIEEMSGNVSVVSIKNGKYQVIQTIRSHPAEDAGEIGSAAIKISPDQKYLYASNRGESNTISIYEIDGEGKLISKGYVKSGGKGPRDFSIDPSGNYLLSANGNSDEITIFKRDKTTGKLEDTGKQISVQSPVCIAFF